jgi:exodeoxyribonuclease V alpha subunit
VVTIERLLEHGVLSELDRALAETLGRIADERDERVLLAAALASSGVQNGHTCIELDRAAKRTFLDDAGDPLPDAPLPELSPWLEALRMSRLVAHRGRLDKLPRPLVLDASGRVYLARYFEYERRLAEALLRRVGPAEQNLDPERFRASLRRLFPEGAPGSKEQRLAAVLAVLSRLSVISGGPGTGKTFTVAKILILLQEQALSLGPDPLRIELLAPTGKAAQRLGEAIQKHLAGASLEPRVAASIPSVASTIHRALRYQPRSPTRFRHGRENPLPADVVVVDEASMVDLALMAKLVDAVSDDARLVLIGDKDQLASVEAGSILADMYSGRERGYSKAAGMRVLELTGDALPVGGDQPTLADGMLELSESHRFREGGGISELARAVNAGDAERALAVLRESPHVTLEALPEPERLAGALGRVVEEKLGRLGSATVEEKLALLDGFRLLCAHRRGPYGVETLNEWVVAHLRKRGLLEGDGDFYDGRPIIVTENDYQVELYNGDVGVIGRDAPDSPLTARFGRGALERRSVPLALLPPHETAFAMSVHKAQGSEFDEVLLLLGNRPSPLLTRELVYTAVTRARKRVRIFGTAELFASAVGSRVARASGLRERLWGRE